MLRSLTLLAAPAVLLAGCATPRPAWTDRQAAARATAEAAAQVKRCYRTPKVLGEARRISTRLHVRFTPDGSIIGLPVVLSQSGVTPSNAIFADEMAAAAVASVVRCSPLRLPPELYLTGWSDFELTFSPALRG
jgi:hypothetical protein